MASTSYEGRSFAAQEGWRERSLGEHIFIWLAWALAAVFWGASLTMLLGIVDALGHGPAMQPGRMDFRGFAFLFIVVLGGVLVLGGALAYASLMFARRDRSLDPVAEAATARLYDTIERQGGDDMTRDSPDGWGADRRT